MIWLFGNGKTHGRESHVVRLEKLRGEFGLDAEAIEYRLPV